MRYDAKWGKKFFAFSKVNEAMGGIITVFMKTLIEIDSHEQLMYLKMLWNIWRITIMSRICWQKYTKKFYTNRGELSKKFKEKDRHGNA
jgi:hypothetical protein